MESNIVGYVDHLGYLACARCMQRYDKYFVKYPVYADAAPHNTEICDTCGESVAA